MEKLYKITLNGKYWTIKDSVIPAWTDHGEFFTEPQLNTLLAKFKYQRGLWPKGAQIVSYTISDKTETDLVELVFDQQDKELTFENLNGGA